MRLTDLDPSFVNHGEGRHGMGVVFECPVHRDHYLLVWFANPIDGGEKAPPECDPLPRWQRSGETFEDLSLVPSIDASMNCKCGKTRRTVPEACQLTGEGHTPCWHGHITSGQIS